MADEPATAVAMKVLLLLALVARQVNIYGKEMAPAIVAWMAPTWEGLDLAWGIWIWRRVAGMDGWVRVWWRRMLPHKEDLGKHESRKGWLL